MELNRILFGFSRKTESIGLRSKVKGLGGGWGGAAENSDQILKIFYEDSSTSLPLVRPLLIKWFSWIYTHISGLFSI